MPEGLRHPKKASALVARGLCCRRGSAGGFRRAQIALGLVLAEIENNDFVRGAGAAHVELNGFADGLVFLLDVLVVGNHIHGVLIMLGVGLAENHLDGADVLGRLFFLEREFEDVALAQPLEFFHFVVIACDQAALHAQVADGALQFAFGGFEIGLGGSHVALGGADFGGHLSELR